MFVKAITSIAGMKMMVPDETAPSVDWAFPETTSKILALFLPIVEYSTVVLGTCNITISSGFQDLAV